MIFDQKQITFHKIRSHRKVALLCALLAGLPFAIVAEESSAAADPPATQDVFTLDRALQLTLRKSPDILDVDAALANQLADATEAQLPPNPQIKAEYFPEEEELRALGASNGYDFSLSQDFRLSHLGLRQVYAAAMKDVSRIEHQADVIRVLNETVLHYYRYWILSERLHFLEDSRKQANEIVGRIATAIEREETPSTEGNLFLAEVKRFEAEIDVTVAEREMARIELLKAMGLPNRELTVAPPQLRAIPEDSFVLLEFAQTRANLRTLVLARQREAARRYDVARLDLFPTLTATFLYSNSTEWNEPEYGAGVGIRIPLWDWNQAQRQRARAEKKHADAEAKAMDRLTFDLTVEALQKRARAQQKRADTYWNDVVPTYRQAYDLTAHMFNQGQVNMVQLWEVQQSLVRAADNALESMASALTARTRLEQAIGGKIEELPPVKSESPPEN